MNKRIFAVAAAAVFAFAVHAQQGKPGEPAPPVDDPFAEMTEEEMVGLAMERTLAEMGGSMTPGQIAYVAALLSAPEVATALATDGEYSIDMTGDPMDVSMPEETLQSWNGSYEDPQFDYTSSDGGRIGPDYTRQIVATINCWDFRAADPHRGEGPDTAGSPTTKAKSRAKCQVVPVTVVGAPPPSVVDWKLNMVLTQRTWVSIGPISSYLYLPVGFASHERNGTYRPVWKPDRAGNLFDGTQVFHPLGCVNGRFQNVSTLWVKVPPPWHVSRLGFLGLRIQHGRVTLCT